MNLVKSLQSMHETPKAIYNGLFACGVLNDYRADWALALELEQLETSVNTIHRNHG